MSTHMLGFQSFSSFLFHFVLAKLASSGIRVNVQLKIMELNLITTLFIFVAI